MNRRDFLKKTALGASAAFAVALGVREAPEQQYLDVRTGRASKATFVDKDGWIRTSNRTLPGTMTPIPFNQELWSEEILQSYKNNLILARLVN